MAAGRLIVDNIGLHLWMSWFWVRESNSGLHMTGWVMYQLINIEKDDSFLFKFKYIITVCIVCVCVCVYTSEHM